jgi:NADH dehydrogenase
MKKVLVLGGTGFLGRHVCEQLNRLGIRATVPTRRMVHGRSVQMLPLVDVIEADVHDAAQLSRLLPGHDAVINLIAILHGNRQRFQQVHVAFPTRLAQAMQSSGVHRLVHVSALGASEQGPSLYQASKAAGEAVLQAAGLALTVLRPSVIFGAEDRFLNLFAKLQGMFPVVPLAGASSRFQPVWVGDVAQAVVCCVQQPPTIGQTYECTGPEVFTLADLVRLAGRLSGHPRPVIGLPVALGYFQALAMELMPGEPLMSTDNLRSMEVDNIASPGAPNLADLGITAQALEPVAATYLVGCGRADPLLDVRQQASRR